jgi:penicillin-binding protein 2
MQIPIINKPDGKIAYNGDPADWKRMHESMKLVVNGGTASGLRRGLRGYEIAGKTGTAQVKSIAQGKRYNESALNERQYDHAWFMGFAPADAPKIAVAVLIENGKHGSSTAGPVARALFDYAVHRMDKNPIKPDPASLHRIVPNSPAQTNTPPTPSVSASSPTTAQPASTGVLE